MKCVTRRQNKDYRLTLDLNIEIKTHENFLIFSKGPVRIFHKRRAGICIWPDIISSCMYRDRPCTWTLWFDWRKTWNRCRWPSLWQVNLEVNLFPAILQKGNLFMRHRINRKYRNCSRAYKYLFHNCTQNRCWKMKSTRRVQTPTEIFTFPLSFFFSAFIFRLISFFFFLFVFMLFSFSFSFTFFSLFFLVLLFLVFGCLFFSPFWLYSFFPFLFSFLSLISLRFIFPFCLYFCSFSFVFFLCFPFCLLFFHFFFAFNIFRFLFPFRFFFRLGFSFSSFVLTLFFLVFSYFSFCL